MLNKDRFYKCLDVDSNSKKELKKMGYANPYGYSFEAARKKTRKNLEFKGCYDNFIQNQSSKK